MRAPYRPRPLMPLAAALVLVAASGIVMDAGFPDKGWWPLALVGVAGYLLALRGRTIGGALLLGFVGSMYFYLIHISWAEQFLGNIVPMLALCLAETLFFSAGSALITLAYRWVPRAFPTAIGVSALLPVIVAGLWTAREAVASVFPYGGFAWGRVALSQTESPVAQLFPWLGVSGVTFALVLLVAVAIEAMLAPGVRPLLRVTVPVALATALVAVPAFPVVLDDTIRVGAVQGNGKAAYLDQREYGDLLRAQLDATRAIDPDEDLDVLLWPEGSTDVDPLREQSAARVFDALTEAYDAPLVAGSITTDDVDIWNSSLLWLPGEGLADKYDKRHPVPFGEYIPDRAFWRPFAPELIDLVQREYTIGTTDAVFDLGGVVVGVNICYDIVDDGLLRESVLDGAQVIFAQSNNADFGHTDESVQQLAIARARALELGRSIVNISTVGTSAILLPDGSTLTQLEWYQPGVMVEDVPTSTTMTPAAVAGLQIEWLAGLFGLLGLVIAGIGAREAGVADLLVVIPTYNEAESIAEILDRTREAIPEADVLVVDDASPDGTGAIVAARGDGAIHLLSRPGKEGLGHAYTAGFQWGLERGYRFIAEMDADGSHDPADLPAMLGAARDRADLVIGSRWVPGGSVHNWPFSRRVISRGGNAYSRWILGSRIRDITAGFRVYRASTLDALVRHRIASQGYCFQVETAWRIERSGAVVVELPIAFTERAHGRSKMHTGIVVEALARVTGWGLTRGFRSRSLD